MNAIGGSTWLWIGFSLFIFTMLSLDLGLFNRKAHTIKYREAWIWSAVWVTLAMIFAGIVFYYLGTQSGFEFLTGYIIELLEALNEVMEEFRGKMMNLYLFFKARKITGPIVKRVRDYYQHLWSRQSESHCW